MTKTTADEVGKTRQIEQVDRSVSSLMSGERDIEVDLDAREDASAALAKITSHEALCTERWTQSREATARIEKVVTDMQTKLNNRLGPLPVSLLTLMTGVIGFLAHAAWPMPH